MGAQAAISQVQYLEFVDQDLVPDQASVLVARHHPKVFRTIYHHHASVEANLQIGCDMDYSFSGKQFRSPRNRMTVFWGAAPHRVTKVCGDGEIVNVYITIARLMNWGLRDDFVEAIIGGAVVAAKQESEQDITLFDRWSADFKKTDPAWSQLLIGEVEMRFRRLALEGYEILLPGTGRVKGEAGGPATMHHIGQMLRFIADNFSSGISVKDVAGHVGLSPSYAMSLFRRAVGAPIKEHITRIRLSHAQMLLANSDTKILNVAMDSGFGSVSSFYEAFQVHMKKSPAAFRREART